jgi:hypothetical protein
VSQQQQQQQHSLVAMHLVLNVNSNQNATSCCLLKHHSKRATRVGVVNGVAVIIIIIPKRFAGDMALLDRVWTSVVAREPIIVVEPQRICEEKTDQENINEGTLREEK